MYVCRKQNDLLEVFELIEVEDKKKSMNILTASDPINCDDDFLK